MNTTVKITTWYGNNRDGSVNVTCVCSKQKIITLFMFMYTHLNVLRDWITFLDHPDSLVS